MSILRIYDPPECTAEGDPLDWECCRSCDASGQLNAFREPGGFGPVPRNSFVSCDPCGGHGSLKAAALAFLLEGQVEARVVRSAFGSVRCESCSHPMSKGTWEGEFGALTETYVLERALVYLQRGEEPPSWRGGVGPAPVHCSPCDSRCDHGGLVRVHNPDQLPDAPYWSDPLDFETAVRHNVEAGMEVEASWRQVDIRRMGWPCDIRPERLTLLCTRCYAERTKT